MQNNRERQLIDLIKKPILTEKTTRMLEENQYCFSVTKDATKTDIKTAIEYIFNVQVSKVNTMNPPIKQRTVGKFKGKRPQYKKAIVKLNADDKIDLFPET